MRSGNLEAQFLEVGEQFYGADGTPIFRNVGIAKALPKAAGEDEPVRPSRRFAAAVSKVIGKTTPKIAAALGESLRFVEPPTSERAQIASLKAQSKKQISPTPGTKARFLLKKVAQSLADKMPCAPWAGAT